MAVLAAALVLCCSASATAEVTGAADNLRTGWYPDEPSLAPGAVTPGAFGQAFKAQLQGAIMAQPLVANGTLFVVTEDDMAYGLDPLTGAVRWGKKFGTPVNYTEITNGTEVCPDVKPHIGITSTPVIDTATNVAYFVANNSEPGGVDNSSWNMHAVNLANGEEASGFPVRLSGHKPDNGVSGVTLEGNHFLQRPALLMLEGVVYAAFGSHCDFPPFAGVIAGVSTSGQFTTLWASTNTEGSIWQSGGGLISDGPKQIMFTTGNGTPSGAGDPAKGPGSSPPEGSLAESVVRLQVRPEGHLKATDFFSPFNNKELDKEDFDLGSAAPLALPSQYFGTPADPNLLVQSGKKGAVYLLNRSELGGMGQGVKGSDKVIEEKGLGEYGGVWDGFALWPGDGGYVYVPGVSKPATGQDNFDFLRFFKYGVSGGVPKLSVAAKSGEEFGFGSGSPIVTSNGTTSGSGVLWITHCANYEISHCEGAELQAYNAVPVGATTQRLWSAPIGFASKFSRPGASGGRIYVGNHEGQLFGFSGPALSPSTSSLEFGGVPVGGQRIGSVTLVNTGSVPLGLVAVRPPPAPFTISGIPSPIQPGQAVTVQVAFSPTAVGAYGGSFGVTTQAGETTVALSGSGTSPVALLASSGTHGASASRVVLDRLKLRFIASKSARHKRKARVSFRLSSASKVRIVVYRRVVSHRCPRKARSCIRYLPTATKLTVTGRAGSNQFTLDLTRLGRGNYRLGATPIVPSNTATLTRSVSFTIH